MSPSAGVDPERKATGLSASTARFYGDATGVASLQEVAWIQRVPLDPVSGERRVEQGKENEVSPIFLVF